MGLGGLSLNGVFKGGIRNTILPCEITKTKGKSQIFKNISDGFRYFEFEGGGVNKVDENGNMQKKRGNFLRKNFFFENFLKKNIFRKSFFSKNYWKNNFFRKIFHQILQGGNYSLLLGGNEVISSVYTYQKKITKKRT